MFTWSQHPAAMVAMLASAGLRFDHLGTIGTAAGLAVTQKELRFMYLKKLIQSLSCLVFGLFVVFFFFNVSIRGDSRLCDYILE